MTVSSNRATLTVSAVNDGIVDPNEQFALQVYSDPSRSVLVSSSSNVTIRDATLDSLQGKLTIPKLLFEGKVPPSGVINIKADFREPGSGGIHHYK
jgi:hypothetical protein